MPKIAVLGAGSIGAYIGAALTHAGGEVVMIGRARMAQQVAEHGLHLTDLHGGAVSLAPQQVHYSQDPARLADADLILVTVKSADTAQAANTIAEHAGAGTLVVSFQNGIGNADTLRAVLPHHLVLGGMVPFNVVQMPGGRLHRGTEGELMLQASPAIEGWQPLFASAGVPLQERDDFTAVQWGKLLLNLNNSVNALSGLPLKTQLSQRAYRRCLADLVERPWRCWLQPVSLLQNRAHRPATPAHAAAPARLLVHPHRRRHAAHRPRGALVDVGRSAGRAPHRD